jgi:hypothetical protein
MRNIFLPCAIALLLLGCNRAPTDTERAQLDRALHNFGFTHGRDYHFAMFACDQHDAYRFVFTAENSSGETVTGQLCAGMFFKAWTVRVD